MRIASNQLKAILNFAKSELAPIYDEREIKSFFYLLCEHYLHLDKTKVILYPDRAVSESELLKFNFAIKDLKAERPIQYILGETEFCGMPFKVNKHTLIPRPETEELVNWIVESESADKPLNLIDIGTGSGCIAISISKKLPTAKIIGVDISEDALQVARINNERLQASVHFDKLDILEGEYSSDSKFNLIVSNPPYVLESEKSLMKRNVLENEPSVALFVKDNDPLLFYKKIVQFAEHQLHSGGKLYFEINEGLGNDMKDLLSSFSYSSIELRNDLFERARMIRATKK